VLRKAVFILQSRRGLKEGRRRREKKHQIRGIVLASAAAVGPGSRAHDPGPPDLLGEPDGPDAAAADEAVASSQAASSATDERAAEPAAKLSRADQRRVGARNASRCRCRRLRAHVNADDAVGEARDDVPDDPPATPGLEVQANSLEAMKFSPTFSPPFSSFSFSFSFLQ